MKTIFISVKASVACFILFLCTFLVAQAQQSPRDVVYLKNGSVIKGIIIEQIPNESIKLKTGDGNIFVYKTDEIEKIVKEEVPAKKEEYNGVASRKGVYLGVALDPGGSYYYDKTFDAQYQSTSGLSIQSQLARGSLTPGLSCTVYPTEHVGIATGFTIARYGTTYETSGYSLDQLKSTVEITYINIPLTLSFITGDPDRTGFYFDIGPQFGFLVGVSSKTSGTLIGANPSTDNLSSYYTSFQLFGNLTIGVHVPMENNRFSLDVGPYLNTGFLNAYTAPYSTSGDYATSAAIGIALHFKVRILPL